MSDTHIIEGALVAARDYLRTAANPEVTYGYYPGGTDPRDFTPDGEVCTPVEIASHKAACEAWERGERPDPCGPHGPLPPEMRAAGKEGWTTTAFYGMGTYAYRDEDAEDVLDQVEAALAALNGGNDGTR
jgi:hypothetical protein